MSHKVQHYGFIYDGTRRNKDWQFGGLSGITNQEVLRADGQWDSYLPVFESQKNVKFDTMACVTFSALNCIETLVKRKYDETLNLSDRFTAKMSGTTIHGNNFYNVAESIRKNGLVKEASWPFAPWLQTFDDYYTAIPDVIVKESTQIYERFKINYEYVWDTTDSLVDALQYAPVQIGMYAYCPYDAPSDLFLSCNFNGNHAVMLYGYVAGQYWKVYDHYERKFKKLAWDYRFFGALKYSVEKINPTPMPGYKFLENHRYFVAEGHGATLFYFGGMLRYDDLAKCLDQWIGRNDDGVTGDFLQGKSHTILLKDIEGVKIYNLKGEEVQLP